MFLKKGLSLLRSKPIASISQCGRSSASQPRPMISTQIGKRRCSFLAQTRPSRVDSLMKSSFKLRSFCTSGHRPGVVEGPLYEKARNLLKDSHFDECLKVSLKLLETEPDSWMAHMYAAVSYYSLSDWNKGIEHFDSVLAKRPREIHAHFYKGCCLEQLKQWEKALESFNNALNINDRHTPALWHKAHILEAFGKLEEATRTFRKISFIELSHLSFYHTARCYARLEKWDDALEHYEKALESLTAHPPTHLGKATVYQHQGKWRSALDTLDIMLELYPTHHDGLFSKALTLKYLNKYDQSLEVLDKLLHLTDSVSEALELKANVLHHLERYGEALKVLDKVLYRQPDNLAALKEKAEILKKLGDDETAEEIEAQLHQVQSKKIANFLEMGSMAWKQSKYMDALRCYESVIEIDPKNSTALLGRGLTLTHLGKGNEAKKSLEKAVELDPNNAIGYFYLGQVYQVTDTLADALKAYQTSAKLQPDNTEAVVKSGLVLLRMSRYQEALDAFNEALKAEPNHEKAQADVLGFSLVLPLFPYLRKDYGMTYAALGMLQSSNAAAQLISVPLIGSLSDKFGRKPLLLLCVIGTLVSFVLLATANSVWMLFASRILDGLLGGNISLAQAYITDLTSKEERSRGMGILGAAFGLGFIVGPAVGGTLCKYDQNLPSWLAAGLSLLNLLCVIFFLPETKINPAIVDSTGKSLSHDFKTFSLSYIFSPTINVIREVMTHPLLSGVLLLKLLHSIVFVMFELWFGIFTSDMLHLKAQYSSYILALYGIVYSLVQGTAIRGLSQRFDEKMLLAHVLSLSALTYGITFLVSSVFSFTIMIIPLAVFSGISNTLVSSLVSKQVDPSLVGGALGISAALGSFSRMIAPMLTSYASQKISLHATPMMCALLCAFLVAYTMKLFQPPAAGEKKSAKPSVSLSHQTL